MDYADNAIDPSDDERFLQRAQGGFFASMLQVDMASLMEWDSNKKTLGVERCTTSRVYGVKLTPCV